VVQRFLLDISPTGVQHSVEINHDGDEITLIEHTPTLVENVILDENQRMRSLHQRKSNFQLAAKIPVNTWQGWKKEWREKYRDIYTWPTFEVIKLNNRDNCKLRVGNQRGAFGKRL
jgi:hypothetical protein